MMGLIISVVLTYFIVFKWIRIDRILKTVQFGGSLRFYGWLYVALLVFVVWLVINYILLFFGIVG